MPTLERVATDLPAWTAAPPSDFAADTSPPTAEFAECLASSTFALARLLCAEAAALVPRFEDSARVRLRAFPG